MREGVVSQLVILMLLLFFLPVTVGRIFCRIDRGGMNLPFCWISGQICLWAGFQLICVPLVLFPREYGFQMVIRLFIAYMASMLVMSLGVGIRRAAGGKTMAPAKRQEPYDRGTLILWLIVLLLLVMQLFLAGFLAYEEGDDAFYVATSTITVSSDTMYQVLPYTGGGTGLDARHGLAPFPIWVAMLARLSGLHAATVAQIVLPILLITMAYAIYFLLGRRLFGDYSRKLPIFMLLLEIMIIFGGQSLYTPENFLLVRTAQGKAVLANIVIPFIFLMLLILVQNLKENNKIEIVYWILMAMTFVTGCLCSTQGALLTCLLLGAGGVCAVLCYRRWKILLPMAGCCVMPVGFALLYLFLD